MYKIAIFLITLIFSLNPVTSDDTKFILHDRCINLLYKPAASFFKDSEVNVIRDSRGIILRFELKNPKGEYYKLTESTKNLLTKIEYFLAKNKNPVIIEVHTAQVLPEEFDNLKRWELSAVVAGKIEDYLRKDVNPFKGNLHSVGYGEFLPENNTPNNGGKLLNRVDIIILCNISGE